MHCVNWLTQLSLCDFKGKNKQINKQLQNNDYHCNRDYLSSNFLLFFVGFDLLSSVILKIPFNREFKCFCLKEFQRSHFKHKLNHININTFWFVCCLTLYYIVYIRCAGRDTVEYILSMPVTIHNIKCLLIEPISFWTLI